MTTVKPERRQFQFGEFLKLSRWTLGLIFGLQPKYAWTYLVTSTIYNLQDLVYAYIFGRAIDALIKAAQTKGSSLTDLLPYVGALFLYNIVTSVVAGFNNYSDNALSLTSRPKVRQSFYTVLHNLGIQTLEQPEVNNKIYRANDYLSNILPLMDGLITLISDVIRFVTTLIAVATFLPILIPLTLVFVIPYYLFDKKYRALRFKLDFETTDDARKAAQNNQILTFPPNLQEVYITESFHFLDRKYMDFQNWYLKLRLKLMQKNNIGIRLLMVPFDITNFAGFLYIANNLIKGLVTVGGLTFQTRMIALLQLSVRSVVRDINDLFESSIQLEDTFKLYQMKPAFGDGLKTVPGDAGVAPEIEFRNVSFKYPGSEKYIFKDLNFRVAAGEKLAIVGENGVGKTTIIKLICRMYQVNDGLIMINGINLNDLKINDWYKHIGVLFQDFNSYQHLSAAENIAIGNTAIPVDERKVEEAAGKADALNFITAFPQKFGQILSERFHGGIRPSTGQWQKIAIARFFYRDSPVVIFDEPTASIDAVSEYNIFNRIYESFKGKSVIIISHRFSTVRNADRIIVLAHGEIVEEGTHQALLDRHGVYEKAFQLQAQGYANDTDQNQSET